MAKANIETRAGTKIIVEGTADEVAAIISTVQSRDRGLEVRESFIKGAQRKKRVGGSSIQSRILELRESGFFNKPQGIVAVRDKLSEKGHMYPLPTVSTSLIRLVRKRELRRVKEGVVWQYVKI